MRKILMIAFVLVISLGSAQNDIYQKVSTVVKQNNPTLVTQSKLLVINFTDLKSDKSSFTSLEKTGDVYQTAKLKGGRNGVVCVAVVNNTQEEIALNKEGYKHIMVINRSLLENVDMSDLQNITFNSNGEVVFKNLLPGKIYESVNNLITR